MRKIVFNALITVLISLSTFLVLTNPNVVNAADSSVGQSEASVSFFGKEASGDTNTGGASDDGGYSNPGSGGSSDDNGFVESQSTLPQTGEIQTVNLSLFGYLLLAFTSILLIEKRLEKNFNR